MTYFKGWRPSLPDPRNIPADLSGIQIKPEVDPRGDMQDPYDQGQLGSCTANTVAGAIEYDSILDGKSFGTPSRLFIYYGEREIEGDLDKGDTGAFGHDGFKVAHRTGVPPETDWPYDIRRFQEKPPQEAYDAASAHKIGGRYRHLSYNLQAFKAALSNNQTVAFGFTVYESFESRQVASSGVVPMPDPSRERQLGGHEVLLIGYLAQYPDYGLVRNSWGTDWGDGGYCLMPWSYLLDSNYSSDFRTIHRPLGT